MVNKQVTQGAWLAIVAISRQQPEDRVFLGWRTSTQGGPIGHIFWFLFNIQLSRIFQVEADYSKMDQRVSVDGYVGLEVPNLSIIGSPQLSDMGDIEIAFFDVRNPLYCKMRIQIPT